MKIKLSVLLLAMFSFNVINAQMPEDVFRKPLKEVLTDVEKRYDIKLQYSENLVKDLEVSYATWRYRMDPERLLPIFSFRLIWFIRKQLTKLIRSAGFPTIREARKKAGNIWTGFCQAIPDCRTGRPARLNSENVFLNSSVFLPCPERSPSIPYIPRNGNLTAILWRM